MAQCRARATKAPEQSAIRVVSDSEVLTLQVSSPLPRKTQKAETPLQEPTTWADVMKNSLGRGQPTEPSPSPPQRKHNRDDDNAGAGKWRRRNWGDEEVWDRSYYHYGDDNDETGDPRHGG